MKQILSYIVNLPARKKVKYITILCCIIFAVVLQIIGNNIKKELPDEQVADAWDTDGGYSQISVFLSNGAVTDADRYKEVSYTLGNMLNQENIETEAAGRLMVGAYSGSGSVSLNYNKNSVTVNALGVGGDFFQFHPIYLLDGTTFNDDYLMQDYVIIDPKTAWTLFGSNEVAGMSVTINDVPFIVAGVYEPTDAYLSEAAGLDQSLVYMFYGKLQEFGSVNGINCMEFLLPNPVSGYGMKIVKENAGFDDTTSVIVENSNRFSTMNLYKMALTYSERSMSKKNIIYPYWENMARGYEDVLMFMLYLKTAAWLTVFILLWITIHPLKQVKRGLGLLEKKLKGRKYHDEEAYYEEEE